MATEMPPRRSSARATSSAPRSPRSSPPRALPSSPAAATATSWRRWSPRSRRPAARSSARSLDARKEEEITAFLQRRRPAAPLEVCIFNIGANVNFPILDTTERVFRKVWEMACYSGFLAGREAARLMLPRGRGQHLLHRRHRQHARRRRLCRLRQRQVRAARGGAERWRASSGRRTSMSRIWSSTPASTPPGCASGSRSARAPEALANLDPDRLMRPESVAEAYWQLYQQPRDAWTFEMEIRPFKETW